jgi:large subunit ribosomal protein L32e
MRAKTFLRRNTREYSKLGVRRKKLQKWRSPKGRDNKMRLREKGRPRTVEIGYKQDLRTRGKIDDKEVFFIQNMEELKGVHKGSVVMLGRFGSKTKLGMAKIVKDKELKVVNFSFGKFEKTHAKKTEHRKKKKEAKKADTKKAKESKK